ncbi:MFS transporter, partial [Nevskia ramosa]|uniref:MFS transporter n=1 Tax=Nevskia ramosa TaxID=64002 RepID=UPI002357035B
MSRRTIAMFALIIAGEAVFMLPFVVARVFRSAFLAVFGLSNLLLGSAFSVYGIVAMVSYLLGGPLADRFAARTLITVALVATAAGGVVFALIPSIPMLIALYGYWGLTTILLFWAALIRATREWGAEDAQGRAYGVLDGGRGLLAALLASAAVVVFA